MIAKLWKHAVNEAIDVLHKTNGERGTTRGLEGGLIHPVHTRNEI